MSQMHELVNELDEALRRVSNDRFGYGPRVQMIDRIKKEEEFRRTNFQAHLENDSSTGAHCQRLLLTSHVDSRFRSCCNHNCGEDGDAGMPKQDPTRPSRRETMVDFHQRVNKRKPNYTDWNDACKVSLFAQPTYHIQISMNHFLKGYSKICKLPFLPNLMPNGN